MSIAHQSLRLSQLSSNWSTEKVIHVGFVKSTTVCDECDDLWTVSSATSVATKTLFHGRLKSAQNSALITALRDAWTTVYWRSLDRILEMSVDMIYNPDMCVRDVVYTSGLFG